jgi:hypothetical protein
MRSLDPRLPFLLVLGAGTLGAPGLRAQEERIESHPDGSVKVRYHVDASGRKHGAYEGFARGGTRVLLASYRAGKRDGAWREWTEDGKRLRAHTFRADVLHGRWEEWHPDGRLAAAGGYRDGAREGAWVEHDASGERSRHLTYRAGRLHGPARVVGDGKVLSRQVWQDGELAQLDDLRPFPTPRAALREQLRAILGAPAPAPDAKDPLAPKRHAALRRLQAYRRLCGLPHEDLVLVPDWNLRCDAASELCRRLGRLDHTPPRPPGVDDQLYQLGLDGARHSNLNMSSHGTLADSVDGYFDDSDPTNIDRVGHRRWCLDPSMARTGFGSSGSFHAMWSMGGTGKAPSDLAAVYYPPRGHVPVDFFGRRHAFSIMLHRGPSPKAADVRFTVRALDADWLPAGPPLPLDHAAVTPAGFGDAGCLVFRPTGIEVAPGRSYLVEVSFDAGKTHAHRYVVSFCEAVRG